MNVASATRPTLSYAARPLDKDFAKSLYNEGEQLTDIFRALDNTAVDTDPRPGFVSFARGPQGGQVIGQFTEDPKNGANHTLAINNPSWGAEICKTYTFSGAGLDIESHNFSTFNSKDVTNYHIAFGPQDQSTQQRTVLNPNGQIV